MPPYRSRLGAVVVAGTLACLTPVIGPAGSAAAARAVRATPSIALSYAKGVLSPGGGTVQVTAKVKRASTCQLAVSGQPALFVSISPTGPVDCGDGQAQMTVTYGSNLDAGETVVNLHFVAVGGVRAKRNISFQVGAGQAFAPPVPPAGEAYLGAWVNPNGSKDEPPQAQALESDSQSDVPPGIADTLGILHYYVPFDEDLTTMSTVLAQISGAPLDAVPLLDWGGSGSCGSSCESYLEGIRSGAHNATVDAFAQALKNFAKPVFLRFFWEMNLHLSPSDGPLYIGAWDQIHLLFSEDDVTNVAFVWCPSASPHSGPPSPAWTRTLSAFYPGPSEVDWIAADRYDDHSKGATTFSDLFSSWYSLWRGQGRPMMVAETGGLMDGSTPGSSCPTGVVGSPDDEQARYIDSIGTALKAPPTAPPSAAEYSEIRAVVYFDSSGNRGSWCFDGGGLAAFSTLAHSASFAFAAPGG